MEQVGDALRTKVRGDKGDNDRSTILPDSLIPGLKQQLQDVKALHQKDLAEGYGETHLSNALSAKYLNALQRLGMAIHFPCLTTLHRSTYRHGTPPYARALSAPPPSKAAYSASE